MKTLSVLLFLAGSLASAQTFHVTSIHRATRNDEKTYHTAFDQNIITGNIGDKSYTLEQLAAFNYYHFEAGADYPVVKVTDNVLKVQVTDKKGRLSTESLNVITVAEKSQ